MLAYFFSMLGITTVKKHNASIISLEGIKLWQTTPAQLAKEVKETSTYMYIASNIFPPEFSWRGVRARLTALPAT